jgi:FAD/FMN-containing dehydrogenase
MQDTMEMITDELTPKLRDLVPGGTTYLSEGDFRDPEWKQSFYGANYESLEKIKNKYDPEHLFYALTVSLYIQSPTIEHYG